MEEHCISRGPKFLPWPEPADDNFGVHVGSQSADEYGDKGPLHLMCYQPLECERPRNASTSFGIFEIG
eukprot:1924171-Amphidinium_carterae.2